MNKSLSRDPTKLSSNKENRAITPKETPQKSSHRLDSSSKDKSRVSREVFKEQDSNIKIFSVKSTPSRPKTDGSTSTQLTSRLNEEIMKNERLESHIEQLQHEIRTLREALEMLNTKRESENTDRSSPEEFVALETKARRLEFELNKNMGRILNYDKVTIEIEELRLEKDRQAILFEKEKASLESRIHELKEQLELRDQKLEQRITNEHNNRHMLNANLNKALDQNDKWKKLYMMEAKNLIAVQNQYKSLIEDNKCHLEYITQLESKIQQSETKYYDLYTDYNQRLTEYRIENLKNTQAELERIRNDYKDEEFKHIEDQMMIFALQNELNKEKEVSASFKGQLDSLLDLKQELERNLAMSRHNVLDVTGKLEEECAKVAALEDMRISDLQYISNLEEGY